MKKRPDIPELGPLEFQLMRILWEAQPVTAREVLEAHNKIARRSLKYTTVMTLLTRMVEKGVLRVDRSGIPFRFRPCVARDQILRQRLCEFVDLFFDGRAVDLALRLVEEEHLSEETVHRLERLLRRSRSDKGATSKGRKKS